MSKRPAEDQLTKDGNAAAPANADAAAATAKKEKLTGAAELAAKAASGGAGGFEALLGGNAGASAFGGSDGVSWGSNDGSATAGGFGSIGGGFGSSSNIFGDSGTGGAAASTSTFGSTEGFGSTAGFGAVTGGSADTAASGGGFGSSTSPTAAGVFGALEQSQDGNTTWGKSTPDSAPDAAMPVFGSGSATDGKEKLLGAKSEQDTGETGETHLFSMKAKLHQFVTNQKGGGEYKARGRGMTLTLNATKSKPKKYRLVARQDMTKVLCLNAPVWAGINPTLEPPKNLMVQCIDYSEDAKADTDATKNTAPKTVQLFLIGGGQSDIRTLNLKLKEVVAKLPKVDKAAGGGGAAEGGASAKTAVGGSGGKSGAAQLGNYSPTGAFYSPTVLHAERLAAATTVP